MKFSPLQHSIQATSALPKILLSAALLGGLLTPIAITASPPSPAAPILIATAYTDITLPTLRRGDRGRSVQLLQQILLDDNFLSAAGVKLGNPQGSVVDGVFGPITEAAVKDLQQYHNIPVTGQVNPRTWETIDMHENPYRSPLPWK